MNVLIIEDERHNAERLTRLLNSSFDDITVYGPLPSIADIRRFFNEPEKIDLILADIRLSDGLSFDALKDIPGDIPVIFTTAYDEYAIKAFHYNGIAYLLKPVDKEELVEAVEKSRRMITPLGDKGDSGDIPAFARETGGISPAVSCSGERRIYHCACIRNKLHLR